ncbi:hypothetical protein HK104_003151 [Borealophlyctis nickersoniae]|nr:hypothetical protein HK104_003151 [Borealophlyctis nickersoniae]
MLAMDDAVPTPDGQADTTLAPSENPPLVENEEGAGKNEEAGPAETRTKRSPRQRKPNQLKSDIVAAAASRQGPKSASLQPQDATDAAETKPAAPAPTAGKQPGGYNNPNRVLTGGADKTRLTGEELEKKMAAMKLRNEEIRRKTEEAAADEAAWQDSESKRMQEDAAAQEAERQRRLEEREAARKKREESKAYQDALRREREENAQRKSQAMASREWDQDKGQGNAESDFPRTGTANTWGTRRRGNENWGQNDRDGGSGDRGWSHWDHDVRTSSDQSGGNQSGGNRYSGGGFRGGRGGGNRPRQRREDGPGVEPTGWNDPASASKSGSWGDAM